MKNACISATSPMSPSLSFRVLPGPAGDNYVTGVCAIVTLFRRAMETDAPLKSYLKMYRRRTGLSQTDVSYLIGLNDGSNISRHERGRRVPALENLLAYEIIYGTAAGGLYEGLMHSIKEVLLLRAIGLSGRLRRTPRSKARDAKLAFLTKLIASDSSTSNI